MEVTKEVTRTVKRVKKQMFTSQGEIEQEASRFLMARQ